MLFATLDVSQRNIRLDSNHEFILADTVGFVSKLPHSLVEAFKSTLEEVTFSDLLIHVVDAAADDCEFKMNVTHTVLEEIGAGDIPMITVFNKIDLVEDRNSLPLVEEESIQVSAFTGENLDALTDLVKSKIFSDLKRVQLVIPYDKGSITSYLCEKCNVSVMDYRAEGTYFDVELNPADYNRLRQYFVDAE